MYKKPFEAVDGPKIMLLAFAFMMLAQVLFSFILLPFNNFGDDYYIIFNLIGMIAFQAVYITVYIVYTKRRGIVSKFSPRNKLTVWSVLTGVALGFMCLFCFMGLAYLFESLLVGSGYRSQDIQIDGTLSVILIIIATVFAAPICEETIFRGAFLSGVTRIRKDEIGTCFLCGICFALMHINPEQTIYQFCLGTVAAYLTLKTGSVIPSMMMHGTSNALALVMSYTSVGAAIDGFYSMTDNVWVMLLTCLLFPIVGCIVVWLVCKALKKIETKRYGAKFVLPKVIWIDENTCEPVYEGGETPLITDENRIINKGFNPITGAPILVNREELQIALMSEYKKSYEEGGKQKNSYKMLFKIYFIITVSLWLVQLASGYLIAFFDFAKI